MTGKTEILYYYESEGITKNDMENSLRKVGLKSGDTIMVHSDISTFGKIGDIKNKEIFMNKILDCFIRVIGSEGTLVVPTYTYSFCKNQIFNPAESKSTVGTFSEFIRKRKGSIRSEDAIFSHAGFGKNAELLLNNVGKECFGKESFFKRLLECNGKIVNFGKVFDITFMHYIERYFGVDYRFDKRFSGKIERGKLVEKSEFVYYVRYLNSDGMDVVYKMENLENALKEKKLLNKIELGNSSITLSKATDCFEVGLEMLGRNEYAFLAKNPKIVN